MVWSFIGGRSWGQQSGKPLTSESDVGAYVDGLTGFSKLPGITKSFEKVDVNDDNTPFLHKQINGRKGVWRVRIGNVRLKLRSGVPGFKDRYVRNFELLIDPNTGDLLRITSRFDGNDPNMLPEPPAAYAEKQFLSGEEVYHGFPAQAPKINFLEALNSVGSNGIGSPFLAKEIYAVYVMHSEKGRPHRAVWAITLRGIPYRPLTGKPLSLIDVPDEQVVPVWKRNKMRNIVDATTGKVLFATSSPSPMPPGNKGITNRNQH